MKRETKSARKSSCWRRGPPRAPTATGRMEAGGARSSQVGVGVRTACNTGQKKTYLESRKHQKVLFPLDLVSHLKRIVLFKIRLEILAFAMLDCIAGGWAAFDILSV